MGCIVTKKQAKDEPIPVMRRRLTLGEVDEVTGENNIASEEVNQEDRSLLMNLTQQQIWDFIKKDEEKAGRRFSIGSQTDANLHEVSSFGSKQVKLDGEKFDDTLSASSCVGYSCKKGLKPEAPNQDSFLIMKIEDQYALYGVFDGHGRKGHDVSNFVKDMLPKILFSQKEFVDNPPEALLKTFAKVQHLLEKATALQTIDATRSGTTCSVVLHVMSENMLYIAHVGDSRVVLGKRVQTEADQFEWRAHDLTQDHKPDLPEERERIEKAGGW